MKYSQQKGFTVPEVLVAGIILVIISVSTLETFIYTIRLNRGNNLRMQALSVLQKEVEHYRSLKFVPGLETTANLSVHRSAEIRSGNHTRPNRTSADGQVFAITVNVVNVRSADEPSAAVGAVSEEQVEYKEITITATPASAQTEGWLQNLNTSVVVQRVRSN
jgi:type II secretory pathway pseudopilin PulG